MTDPYIVDALQAVPFFTSLKKEDALDLAKKLVPRVFYVGQTIFHLGDPGGLLYIITHGKVKITRTTSEGNETLLVIFGRSDFFGELALIDDAPRSASAIALEKTEVLTLHRDDFLHFMDGNHDFAWQVLQVLTKRIRVLNERMSDIFFLDLPTRLARQLVELAKTHGVKRRDGILIDIYLTQTDLAEMTGATRVSINKAIGLFRRQGMLETQKRKFLIKDIDAFHHYIKTNTI